MVKFAKLKDTYYLFRFWWGDNTKYLKNIWRILTNQACVIRYVPCDLNLI